MHLKISFLFLSGFFLVSVVSNTTQIKLLRDPVLVKELNALAENRQNASINSEMDTTLTLAQLIIDSNIAPESLIHAMQSITTKWRPVEGRASLEDFDNYKNEYKMALGKIVRYKNEDEILNYFSRGAYSALHLKFINEARQRETVYNDMAKAAVEMAKLRLKIN